MIEIFAIVIPLLAIFGSAVILVVCLDYLERVLSRWIYGPVRVDHEE